MAEPDKKTFNFTELEKQVLQTIAQQNNVAMSNFVSFVAISRLAVNVTPNTRFDIAPDFSEVQVWENVPEAETPDASNPPVTAPTVDLGGNK